jgi:hypothetical protein
MRFLCCSVFALLFAGLAVASDHAPEDYPPPQTIDALTTALKSELPPGWSLVYERRFGTIEISRDHAALVDRNAPNAAVPEKPVPRTIEIDLKIVPFVAPENYPRSKAENKEVQGILGAIERQFNADGLSAGPDGAYIDDGRADPAAISYYNKNRSKLRSLPQFHFRDVSLDWGFGYSDDLGFYPWPPVDPGVLRECKDVVKKIEGMLSYK